MSFKNTNKATGSRRFILPGGTFPFEQRSLAPIQLCQ